MNRHEATQNYFSHALRDVSGRRAFLEGGIFRKARESMEKKIVDGFMRPAFSQTKKQIAEIFYIGLSCPVLPLFSKYRFVKFCVFAKIKLTIVFFL